MILTPERVANPGLPRLTPKTFTSLPSRKTFIWWLLALIRAISERAVRKESTLLVVLPPTQIVVSSEFRRTFRRSSSTLILVRPGQNSLGRYTAVVLSIQPQDPSGRGSGDVIVMACSALARKRTGAENLAVISCPTPKRPADGETTTRTRSTVFVTSAIPISEPAGSTSGSGSGVTVGVGEGVVVGVGSVSAAAGAVTSSRLSPTAAGTRTDLTLPVCDTLPTIGAEGGPIHMTRSGAVPLRRPTIHIVANSVDVTITATVFEITSGRSRFTTP